MSNPAGATPPALDPPLASKSLDQKAYNFTGATNPQQISGL
jgi:hypothetical protein